MDSRLITFLQKKRSYPHQPDEVDHIQTHISHVFMAPPYVYKLKKPVDFGFLDYSTLDKRQDMCHREIELNRRLCDDIYLGVVAIVQDNGQLILEPEKGDGSVVEYAVKMKQLPEEYFLYRYIEEGRLETSHLDRVTDFLSSFYNEQSPGDDVLQWGEIEKIRFNTDENFDQTEQFIGQTLNERTFNTIREFTDRYFNRHQELFERRITEERIVDGHGDLHLDHIHITPDKVRIYDCIEFNDRFRFGDLAADLAFLAMDLDFKNCWQAERYFVEQMAEKLGDPDLLNIIDFYKCYRAYVKGKVKSLQSVEEEVPKQERQRAAEKASRYFNLALRYAMLGSQPTAVIFMGRVASGKSTLAEHVADKLNIDRFSSDIIRKKLAGLPLNERTPESKRSDLYSKEMSEKTYEALRKNAEENLEADKSVILDATFSKRRHRQELQDMFREAGYEYIFVEAGASDQIIKERLKARQQNADVVSDARLEDFEMLSNAYESPGDINREHLIQINTGSTKEETLQELYEKLVDRNI